jgi:hypothetical protein
MGRRYPERPSPQRKDANLSVAARPLEAFSHLAVRPRLDAQLRRRDEHAHAVDDDHSVLDRERDNGVTVAVSREAASGGLGLGHGGLLRTR